MAPTNGFESAYAAFAATAAAWPDNAFLCIPARPDRDYHPNGVEFDYRTASTRIEALRRLYERSGVGHGHRVALLLGNRPEHFFHLFALNSLGASVVPLNPDNTADEMLYAVEHSETDLAFAARTDQGTRGPDFSGRRPPRGCRGKHASAGRAAR